MPVNRGDRDFLRGMHRNLSDGALDPTSTFYEPIYSELPLEDPVGRLSTLIDFDGVESIQLFSGFRGSGKTTELRRLKRGLEDDSQDYFIVYADALEYVNPAEPIDITDLLIALAGAFSDALEPMLGTDIARESFWARFTNFLTNTDVRINEAGLKAEAATPGKDLLGSLKAGIDVKVELKTGSSFRQQIQSLLANRLGELKNQVDRFFEDGIKQVRAKHGERTKIVFLFDQLEQIRGTRQTEQDVIRSVERIFAVNFDMLKIPYVHVVYTVPPWLKFVLPAMVQITLLPTVHLWNNDTERTRCEPAWTVFRSLVRRRLGDVGLARLFGNDEAIRQRSVDRVIDVCGGHFRDLLRLLRDVVVRAVSLDALPVHSGLLDDAINAARRDFLPIAQEDAKWLDEIARVRATALPNTDAGPVNRLTRYLDSHFVLYFVNADEWYDIHPLIRGEVTEVMQAAERAAGS